MNDAELEMIADYMGHSVKIHTTVYKLQQNLIARSKVSAVLTLLENGKINELKRKEPVSLESVDIDVGELGQ